LQSHDQWKQFLPTLRAETLAQQKRYDDLVYVPEGMDEEYEDDEGGIDLGSAYAQSLGFDEAPPSPDSGSPRSNSPSKNSKKKKKKRDRKKRLSVATEIPINEEDEEDNPQTNHVDSKTGKEEINTKKSEESTTPDWWSSMVTELQQAEESTHQKEDESSLDWWHELKSELQTTDVSPKKSATSPQKETTSPQKETTTPQKEATATN